MSFPRSDKRPSIKSGTWEVAQGSDVWLDYGDEASSVASSITEVRETSVINRSQVIEAPSPANCVPSNYLSEIETAILRSEIRPIGSNEVEE